MPHPGFSASGVRGGGGQIGTYSVKVFFSADATTMPVSPPPPDEAAWLLLDPVARGLALGLWSAARRRDGRLPDDLARWWRWSGLVAWAPAPPSGTALAVPVPAAVPARRTQRGDAADGAVLAAALGGLDVQQPLTALVMEAWQRLWWPEIRTLLHPVADGWAFSSPPPLGTRAAADKGGDGTGRRTSPRPRRGADAPVPAGELHDPGAPPLAWDPLRVVDTWQQSAPGNGGVDLWTHALPLLDPVQPERARPLLGRLVRDHGADAVAAAIARLGRCAAAPADPHAWLQAHLRQARRNSDGGGHLVI